MGFVHSTMLKPFKCIQQKCRHPLCACVCVFVYGGICNMRHSIASSTLTIYSYNNFSWSQGHLMSRKNLFFNLKRIKLIQNRNNVLFCGSVGWLAHSSLQKLQTFNSNKNWEFICTFVSFCSFLLRQEKSQTLTGIGWMIKTRIDTHFGIVFFFCLSAK